jgi:hypothetical protein
MIPFADTSPLCYPEALLKATLDRFSGGLAR